MALTEQDLTKVGEVVRTEIRSFLDDQGLDFNKHSEHHTFICSFRRCIRWASYSVIFIAVGGVLSFLGKVILEANGWFI